MGLTEREEEIADRIREEAPGNVLRLDADVVGFLVVQELPTASSPHLYRVTVEKQVDGSESLHWTLLGPVNRPGSDDQDEHTPL